MNLKNLVKLYNVNNIVQDKYQNIGGSNNLIKWLFSQETETDSQTTSSLETSGINIVPSIPDPSIPDPSIPALVITEPVSPVTVSQPVLDYVKRKQLMIIFVGLPKCGKTQMSIYILTMLKQLNLKTKFVETPIGLDDFKTRMYLDKIKKHIDANNDVIICNGNNYEENVRKSVITIAKENSVDILFVDFKHSEDTYNSFDKYKEFCSKKIQARTDTVALNTDLTKAILNYNEITNDELDGNSYIKIFINHNNQTNINSIILKVKEIFGKKK